MVFLFEAKLILIGKWDDGDDNVDLYVRICTADLNYAAWFGEIRTFLYSLPVSLVDECPVLSKTSN